MSRKKGLTRKQKDYWYFTRYDALLLEGFAPEEAGVISLTRISSAPVMRLRRQRKRVLSAYLQRDIPVREAIEATRAYFRETDQNILTWQDFRQYLYPTIPSFV